MVLAVIRAPIILLVPPVFFLVALAVVPSVILAPTIFVVLAVVPSVILALIIVVVSSVILVSSSCKCSDSVETFG